MGPAGISRRTLAYIGEQPEYACHAGGRRFEPDQRRHLKPASHKVMRVFRCFRNAPVALLVLTFQGTWRPHPYVVEPGHGRLCATSARPPVQISEKKEAKQYQQNAPRLR